MDENSIKQALSSAYIEGYLQAARIAHFNPKVDDVYQLTLKYFDGQLRFDNGQTLADRIGTCADGIYEALVAAAPPR